MYDPILKKKFEATSRKSQSIEWFTQNKQVEPIWATNQKAGENRRSAAEWIGSNMVFNKQKIIDIPYNASTSFTELIDQFIGFFTHPKKPINFGAIYFNEPDLTGHSHGPYSEEMRKKLIELDNVLGYLIDRLQSNNLYDKLNLIVTSDHGMEATSLDRIVVLEEFINLTLIDVFGSATIRSIFLKNRNRYNLFRILIIFLLALIIL
jgi:predicted AlkP superfamily pyrophosphatase or phosphodiesterase